MRGSDRPYIQRLVIQRKKLLYKRAINQSDHVKVGTLWDIAPGIQPKPLKIS